MGTVTKAFGARLANWPLLSFDFWALWRSTLSASLHSARKSKTISGRLAGLASNPWVSVAILGTLSLNGLTKLHRRLPCGWFSGCRHERTTTFELFWTGMGPIRNFWIRHRQISQRVGLFSYAAHLIQCSAGRRNALMSNGAKRFDTDDVVPAKELAEIKSFC